MMRSFTRTAVVAALLATHAAGPRPLFAQTRTGSLPAPGGLWVAQNSPRGLALVWKTVPGAKGFRLYQVSGSGPERLLGNLAPNVSTFVVILRNEMLSVPQRFSIETIDAAGLPSSRAAFNVVTPIDPGPASGAVPGPASVKLAEGQGGIVVTWDAVPGATAYQLGRSVWPNGLGTLCGLCSTSTTYVDSAIVVGKRHTYTVTAITARGAGRRTASDTLTPTGGGIVAGGGGTGGTGGTAGATGALAAPTALTAQLVMPAAAALSWHTVMGATGYPVTRALCGGAPQLVTTRPGDGMNTEPATVYWQDNMSATTIAQLCTTQRRDVVYTVAATSAAGSSVPATFPTLQLDLAAIAAAGSAASQTVPVAPTQLAAKQSDAATVHLSWLSSPGATSYAIASAYCGSTGAGGAFTIQPPVSTSPTPLSYDVGDIPTASFLETCGDSTKATIVFTIKASNTAGSSPVATFPSVVFTVAPMTVATAGTGTSTLPAPTALVARLVTPTTVELTWTGPAGATTYQLDHTLCGTMQSPITLPASATTTMSYQLVLVTDAIKRYCTSTSSDALFRVAALSSTSTSPTAAFPALHLDLATIFAAAASPTTPPPSPLNLIATASGLSVGLDWQHMTGATSYTISRTVCGQRLLPDITVLVPTTPPGSMTRNETIPWLFVNASCPVGAWVALATYDIAAVNAAGSSPTAHFPSLTLQLPSIVYGTQPPADVTSAKLSVSSTTSLITLTWAQVPNATYYQVTRTIPGSITRSVYRVDRSSMVGVYVGWTDPTVGIIKQNPSYKIQSVNGNGISSGVVVP